MNEYKKGCKVTFGLTAKNMEVIQKHITKFDGAEFDRDTWINIGQEIGWEALTACLWYFRKVKHNLTEPI